MKRLYFILISMILLSVPNNLVYSQQEEEETESMDEVARRMANPNASIGFLAFPIDYIHYGGDLEGANSQNAFKLNFQPSLPYVIKPGHNIFFRPLIPVIFTQPVIGEGGQFESEGVDLGDIGFDLAYGITWESGWITVAGIVGSTPTATNKRLGTGRWMLGPEFFVGKNTSWGMVGILATHSWSLNKNSVDAHDLITTPSDFAFINDVYLADNQPMVNNTLSVTSGQYFYTINLQNAWQIQAQPLFTYNHRAESGNRLTLPLGTGISKTLKVGKNPLKLSLQYWYYVVSPENFGPKHQIRFQVARVVPLPW
ncbi:hypothetical protein [Robertkochia aurantiaca]|uniref:hypothetical protein n=1 Tax=Robertkochia aurantiaca TaxID=2873700 RepID=UPI001CCD027D|nr:hypothetical protein [Robertkochia sp. 3YJGBD-33]